MVLSAQPVKAFAFIDAAQLRSQLDPARQRGTSFAEWGYVDLTRVAQRAVAEVAGRSPSREVVLDRIFIYDVAPREATDPRLEDRAVETAPESCMRRTDARLAREALARASNDEFDMAILVTSGPGLGRLVDGLHDLERGVGVVSFRSGLAGDSHLKADVVGFLPDVSDAAWAYELSSLDGEF